MLIENVLYLFHCIMGLKHHAGRLWVITFYVFIYLSVVFHEYSHELFKKRL
jgi:hypothetical protein